MELHRSGGILTMEMEHRLEEKHTFAIAGMGKNRLGRQTAHGSSRCFGKPITPAPPEGSRLGDV